VVEITDAGVDPATGAPFIVMEFLVGSDLSDVLKQKGPMKPHQLGELLRQAALALDRTHAHGIVHRDLKPENLFVTLRDDGTPHLKVVDFGIAKVIADGMRSTNQTATIGTPAYMAPEQIQSKTNIGAATDVYSLAMVAYTMLVGEPYFAEELELSDNAFQIIVAVTKGLAEPAKSRALRRRGVQLSDAVDAWFSRATALDPAQRYPSAGAMAAAFREAVGVGGDMRMSLPDAGYVGASNMSTGEFIAGQSLQTGGSGRISQGTEVAGPMRFGSGPQPNATGNARTISAAIADPTPTKKSSSKWPYALVGVAVLAGGGFTVTRLMGDDGDTKKKPTANADSDEDKDKPAKSSGPASSGAGQSGTGTADVAAAPAAGASCPPGMLLVGRGTFPMGGTEGESKPVHKVTLGPYCIAKTEVSVAEYKKCVDAGKCVARTDNAGGDLVDSEIKMFADHCNFGKGDRDNHPMNCVGFADAEAYCSFAGARLPTEPEWELAARGVEGREFPWGADIPSAKRLNGCGIECRDVFGKGSKAWDILFSEKDNFVGTAPIGSFPMAPARSAPSTWPATSPSGRPTGSSSTRRASPRSRTQSRPPSPRATRAAPSAEGRS
jgi:formylglycine-generating enzyme required for sulfatase activity